MEGKFFIFSTKHKIKKLFKFIFLLIYFPLSSELYRINKINFYSEITITINRTGTQYILSRGIRDLSYSYYSTYAQYAGPLPDEV